MKYAQRAGEDKNLPQPKAVFAIDSPLDFIRFYQSASRNIALSKRYGQEPSSELRERGMDASSMNITDISGMVNELRRMGNENATLHISSGKGYRQNGTVRHPHSWSIADAGVLVAWLAKW